MWSMCEDLRGDVWLATDDGINVFDPRTGVFRVYARQGRRLHQPQQQSLHGDPRGPRRHAMVRLRLWRSRPIRPRRESFTRVSRDLQGVNGAPSLRVYAFAEEADGEMWMGCVEGVQSYNPRTGRYAAHFIDPQDPYFRAALPASP